MIIDVHAHYHPARFNEALQRLGYPGTFGGPVTDSPDHVQQRLDILAAEDRRRVWSELVEFGETTRIFTNPTDRRTQDYITGRFG